MPFSLIVLAPNKEHAGRNNHENVLVLLEYTENYAVPSIQNFDTVYQ